MNDNGHSRKILCDIARSGFEAVGRLLDRDQRLAGELLSDTTNSRQVYREECLTVEMATTLRDKFPDHVKITLFTPAEEARNGADWYWRFERENLAVHARVQAKRVRRGEVGDPDSSGSIEINKQQLERLLQPANLSKIPGLQAWFATYARFHATPPCGCVNLQDCFSHCHDAGCNAAIPSIWIAMASEVRALPSVVPVRKMIESSLRLDCILPCIDDGRAANGTGPQRKGFALQSGFTAYQDCIATIETDPQLRNEFEGALLIRV